MSPEKFRHRDFFIRSFGVIIILIVIFFGNSCKGKLGVPHVAGNPLKDKQKGLDPETKPWSSWNVVLKPGTRDVMAAVLAAENSFIDGFNALHSGLIGYKISFHVFYCPCDSLLYNIRATLLDGSGESVTSPSPPPPPPGGSGD